jgi:hypothetical protein
MPAQCLRRAFNAWIRHTSNRVNPLKRFNQLKHARLVEHMNERGLDPMVGSGRMDYKNRELMISFGEFTLAVSSGEDVQTTPSQIVGPSLIRFHVREGFADLLHAREAGPASTHNHLPGVAGKATCSVLDLLRAAPCFHGKEASAHGFLPQLIWTLGPLVETSLLGLPFELRCSSSDWVDQSTLTCVGKASGRNDVHSCLFVYIEANARMLRTAMDLGIAVHDGRMGRSPWKLGAYISPRLNFVAWLAPQTHQEF